MWATFLVLIFLFIETHSQQNCPSGWRPSSIDPTKCYFIGVDKKIWFEANAYCFQQAAGGTLTSITSALELFAINALVIDTVSISNCDQMWIGANDFDQNGVFVWTDNKPFTYANWGPGQPDLSNQCVSSQARTTGTWKTEPCGTENCYICETYTSSSGTTLPPPPTTTTTMPPPPPTTTTTMPPLSPITTNGMAMTDCYDWRYLGGATTNGVYTIQPPGSPPFQVYCDMTTDGGGWTVFQRRRDQVLSFHDKTWNDYKNGFSGGDGLGGDHWLGNDKLNLLSTKDINVRLRIDIRGDRCRSPPFPGICGSPPQPDGSWYGEYRFTVGNEATQYVMSTSDILAGTLSSAGSAGFPSSNGRSFATQDRNQGIGIIQSAQLGAWWFSPSIICALNGKYNPDGTNWGMYYNRVVNVLNYDIVPVSTELKLRRSG